MKASTRVGHAVKIIWPQEMHAQRARIDGARSYVGAVGLQNSFKHTCTSKRSNLDIKMHYRLQIGNSSREGSHAKVLTHNEINGV